MKIIIAPDKFKESMTAVQAADAIARGLRQTLGPAVELDLCPVADGGEGTVDALVTATTGQLRTASVTGPHHAPVSARWGMLGDQRTAVIEMAQAAGLALVPPDRREPMQTTTFGVGELIQQALDAGARQLIIGIGGSATNDGGAGMAQALGAVFHGGVMPMNGRALLDVDRIDLTGMDRRIAQAEFIVACDVTNPLTGPHGAAHTYGPQKGATAEQVALLDRALSHLAELMPDVDANAPGMGAAGGLGFGLVAFCHARIESGIDLVLQAVAFDDRVQAADLVITGEGRLDGQSIQGKACLGVARAAARHHVDTIALVGSLAPDAHKTRDHGLTDYYAIVDPPNGPTPAEAIRDGARHLENLARTVAEKRLRPM